MWFVLNIECYISTQKAVFLAIFNSNINGKVSWFTSSNFAAVKQSIPKHKHPVILVEITLELTGILKWYNFGVVDQCT